jgi:MFS family permease
MITNRLLQRGGNVVKIRRAFAFTGFTGASSLLMMSYYIQDPLWAMLAMGMASFSNDLVMPGAWSTCMDVGGRYAGTVSGSMNMMGNLGGVFGPIVIGHILLATNRDWHPIFVVSSVIYFLGGICWAFIDPVTPFDKPAKA